MQTRHRPATAASPCHARGLALRRWSGGSSSPGIVVTSAGEPIAASTLVVADGLIQTIHVVGNPDKLTGVRIVG